MNIHQSNTLFTGGECGVTHSELPTAVADLGAGFCLLYRVHDLFLREL